MLRDQLNEQLQNNEDTELTRKYHDIIQRRDAILQRMNQHYMESSSTKEGTHKL